MFEIIAYICIGIVVLEIVIMLIVLIAMITEEPGDTEKTYYCLLTGRQCINPELGLQGCQGCPEIKEEMEGQA